MNRSHLLYRDVLDIPADEWLERYVYLSREVSPNAPGNLSLAGQPWAREILRTIASPYSREVELVMGAQTGKTTILLLAWLLFARFQPQPCLIGLSTDPLADRLVKRRLMPLIQSNPAWGDKLPPANQGQESMILYPGQYTFYTGARTPSKLASFPASLLLLDEVSKWESGSRKEAHPYMLVRERVKSFPSHKIISSSTPAQPDDAFYQNYTHSTRSHYYMPCPHCGKEFKFEFSNRTLRWGNTKNLDEIRATAHYICPHCERAIHDHHKAAIMARGRWIAENADAPAGHFGFHLSSFYSPFVSFGDIAVEFVKAQASVIKSEALRNFTNSWLAEPWEEQVRKLSEANIRALISQDARVIRGALPPSGEYLYTVIGIDPGVNGTHYCVCAIAADMETQPRLHVVDWGTFHTYTSSEGRKGPAWFLDTATYSGEHIDCGYIDAGFATQAVYDECAAYTSGFLIPSKGTTSTIGIYGETAVRNRAQVNLTTYNDYALKTALEQAKAERRIILPYDVTDDFLDGISGQSLIRTKSGRYQWRELREDHYNDCLKLCLLSTWRFLRPPDIRDDEANAPAANSEQD